VEELRVTIHVSALESLDYGTILASLHERIDPLLHDGGGAPLPGIVASYTGIMPLVQEIQSQLLTDLFESFLSAFITIGIAMTIVLGSIEAGLLAMVSNVFPALLMFGTLGWLGEVVDIGSVMTASVALGLTIDDTLHYLTFFTEGIGRGLSRREAVLLAYRRCGAAKLQTSIICAAGLMVFALSDFLPAGRFAWIMFALIVLAMLGDMLLLPALLLSPLGRWCFPVSETAPLPSPGQDQIPAPRRAAPRLAAAADRARTAP
jgi:predicted RND superfamily exporter protein